MKLTDAQKSAIRTAAFAGIAEALKTMNPDTTHTNLYNEAVSEAKIGATQALMYFTGDVQTRAADLGGLNRATVRTNLSRLN